MVTVIRGDGHLSGDPVSRAAEKGTDPEQFLGTSTASVQGRFSGTFWLVGVFFHRRTLILSLPL